MPQVTQVALAQQQLRRSIRRPQHRFQLRHKPYVIQPCVIAPVLPGETMRSLLFQSRVVTDPIVNPLIGWWIEYYFFYVKHRDLNIRDKTESMVLDPSFDIEATEGVAADVQHYHYGTSVINWSAHCLERITEEYFRAEGEAWNGWLIDTLPVAQVGLQSGLDSAIDDTDYQLIDQTIAHSVGTPDTSQAEDVELALIQYEFLRQHNMVDTSYEDYLKTYGVRTADRELHKPELIRFIREWSYPTNTVDPADGDPSSAVSWSIRERADKDRFFSEPGFVYGVTVARPKIYFSEQDGSLVDMMSDIYSWLPALLTNEPRTALRKFAPGAGGPLQSNTDSYWIDVRDLLLYGDQFVNFALTETDAGMVALPTAAMNKKYPTEAMADALFVDSLGASSLWFVRQDGVANLNIATRQQDTSVPVGTL